MTCDLHLASWDLAGHEAPAVVRALVTTLMPDDDAWLVLEQMHVFDFTGPWRHDVGKRLTDDAIATFGLRGRVFGKRAQIHWRRLDGGMTRVVVASEDPLPTLPATSTPPATGHHVVDYGADRSLIMWGRAANRGPYRELRVGGHDDLHYPQSLVSQYEAPVVPVLLARVYTDPDDGREVHWRLVSAQVSRESEVQRG